jgi:arabinogalactan endo-1,4-beta-galactosidase
MKQVKHVICCALLFALSGILSSAEIAPSRFLTGGDISMMTKMEQAGAIFKDGGQAKDLIGLMMDNGCNCFRLRLFVNPNGRGGVIQDVPYTIALAKRIKAANAVFMLDFHYSDTWADPGKQFKPKAWETLSFDELIKKVETYTAEVILEFKKQNALPDMVQVGNEINPGFLWPEGKLTGKDPNEWTRFSTLLKAGIRGVRNSISPQDKTRIIIHIACGGDFGKTDWFLSNLEKYGVSYDVIGQSFYPWWHGTMKDLQENLSQTAKKFNKDIFVVETAYPYKNVENFESRADHLDAMIWEKTPEGQKAFLDELIKTVRNTPDNHGLGVLWWYPESVPTRRPGGWNGGINALFDSEGNALPAMKSFAISGSPQKKSD